MTDGNIEQMIQDKGLNAPRVTPEDVHNKIFAEYYFVAADACKGGFGELSAEPTEGIDDQDFEELVRNINAQTQLAKSAMSCLTFCVLVLENGFTVTGESACASPENFDAELGRKIARQSAVAKIWPLMGYALKEKLAQEAS